MSTAPRRTSPRSSVAPDAVTLEHIVGYLRCPHCAGDLRLDGATLACAAGHRHDVARQGYVNLLPGGAGASTADSATMVAARAAFFARGHFAPLVDALAAQARRLAGSGPPGCVVDLGAGPGQHLAAVLERLPDRVGVALDLSKHAARRAARAHRRGGAVVCDIWHPLPVRTGAAALVLDVFAPRNGEEIARMLCPGGALLVVTPSAEHLAELVGPLGLLSVDDDKPARVHRQLSAHLTWERERPLAFDMSLRAPDIEALVAMGPSAWHVDPEGIARQAGAMDDPLRVTASVTLSVYRA
jgi:23S rRNA (guanine745-N1)-methyltransferase